MPVNEDLFDALSAVTGLSATTVFDTKLDDGYALTGTVAVFQMISDVPEHFINEIGTRVQRWQVSIHALTLSAGRTVAEAVRTALDGLTQGSIKSCDFDSAPGELYESSAVPPYYFIPLDFLIYV